jgi:formylglycine-generating enzyme required for sulfatase activity
MSTHPTPDRPQFQYQSFLPPSRPLDQMAVPSPVLVEAAALQTFHVTTAQLLLAGAGWQVAQRRVEVQGRTLELGDGVSLPLIAIPAGEFVMGSPVYEPKRQNNEGPQHRVCLEGFLLGQTPITQAQWRAVVREAPPPGQRWERELPLNPSEFSGQPDSAQRPVERVSWQHAMEFCRRLSAMTGDVYTLPSEAQWEYACRAGSTTPFAFAETITPDLANYDGNYSYAIGPKGENREQTTPVRSFPANAWGLHDMHGNVWEWCLDRWHENYIGAPDDGSAWPNQEAGYGGIRLLRGGSWFDRPQACRSACRVGVRPADSNCFVGFRVCCLPPGLPSWPLNP